MFFNFPTGHFCGRRVAESAKAGFSLLRRIADRRKISIVLEISLNSRMPSLVF